MANVQKMLPTVGIDDINNGLVIAAHAGKFFFLELLLFEQHARHRF